MFRIVQALYLSGMLALLLGCASNGSAGEKDTAAVGLKLTPTELAFATPRPQDDCRGKAPIPDNLYGITPDNLLSRLSIEHRKLVGTLWSGKRGGLRCHLLFILDVVPEGNARVNIQAWFGYSPQQGREFSAGSRVVLGTIRGNKLRFDLGDDLRGNHNRLLILTNKGDKLDGVWQKDVSGDRLGSWFMGASNDYIRVTLPITMERVPVPRELR